MSAPGPAPLHVDIALFGAGIAGLWLLALLRRRGYSCVLFAKPPVGGTQTLASQGMLHGGVKYALDGGIGPAARAVAAMPERWSGCLGGQGEVDLRGVPLLAASQLLWTSRDHGSRVAGCVASKAMRGRVSRLTQAEVPPPFDTTQFGGVVYRLHEQVVDVPALVKRLLLLAGERIQRYPLGARLAYHDEGLELQADGQHYRARLAVLAAGEGNAGLLAALGETSPRMQLRPLHMVMVRGALPELYGHGLGATALPRLSVSSHADAQGARIWYLGGALAESGVKRSAAQQIAFARQELSALLPWISQQGLAFGSRRPCRAECLTLGGKRPDGLTLEAKGPLVTVWPTKLVLAPALGDRMLELLASRRFEPSHPETPLDPATALRTAASPPWQDGHWEPSFP